MRHFSRRDGWRDPEDRQECERENKGQRDRSSRDERNRALLEESFDHDAPFWLSDFLAAPKL